jgi:hypothetical protein
LLVDFEEEFNENTVDEFIREYKETIRYAKLTVSGRSYTMRSEAQVKPCATTGLEVSPTRRDSTCMGNEISNRWPGTCLAPPHAVIFTLTRPVLAFSKSEHVITKLPLGAVIQLEVVPATWRTLGLVDVLCEGRHYYVFAREVEAAGKPTAGN